MDESILEKQLESHIQFVGTVIFKTKEKLLGLMK